MIEKPLNVLLLEDLRTDAELIKRQVLKAAPLSVFTIAGNRAEFFEKIEWFRPDVVLADYNLPDINGLEALLHLRQNLPSVPFVFVSGTLNDDEKVAEAVLNGASGYVLKEKLSLLPEKLLQVLGKADTEKAAAQAEKRRWQDAGLKIQKALALLERAPGFEGKESIRATLGGILDMFPS